jgi:hypothetical protein
LDPTAQSIEESDEDEEVCSPQPLSFGSQLLLVLSNHQRTPAGMDGGSNHDWGRISLWRTSGDAKECSFVAAIAVSPIFFFSKTKAK